VLGSVRISVCNILIVIYVLALVKPIYTLNEEITCPADFDDFDGGPPDDHVPSATQTVRRQGIPISWIL
jgi:hypothetical protein